MVISMLKCGDSVKVTQQTLQFVDDGSNPISPHHFKILKGTFSGFSHLLEKYHYKGSKIGGGISYHLILKYKGKVYGGITIGKMRHQNKYEKESVELRRMVLDPSCPKNTASYFLSKTIWWLRKNTNVSIIYTFADQTVGHTGTCYKASNFIYVKDTPPTTHVLWKGKRYHPRSLNIDRPYSYKLREDVKNGSAKVITGKPKSLFKYIIKRKEGEIHPTSKDRGILSQFL